MLETCSHESYCRVLELLLKNEARSGMTDNQGFNAIHYAGLKGHRLALEMVRISLNFSFWGAWWLKSKVPNTRARGRELKPVTAILCL